MNTHADKLTNNKSNAAADKGIQKQSDKDTSLEFVDNRTVSITQRVLQKMGDNNPLIQRRKDIPLEKYVQVNRGDGRWYGVVKAIENNDGQQQYKIRIGGGGKTDLRTVPEQYVEVHPMFGGPEKWQGESDKRLDAMLMESGSLGEINIAEGGWEKIAANLKKEFLPEQKKSEDPASFVKYLCSIIIKNGEDVKIDRLIDSDQVNPAANFVIGFMEQNGQLPYIRKQPWFISGDYYIDILVNYYPDRSGYEDALRFHKDTAGNNIFVNLIFDNQTDIVGTEWFEDAEDPSMVRGEWQKSLLPKTHLEELERSRKALRYIGDPGSNVKGGVSKGKNTYVSWVDDLVWHSTPNKDPRTKIEAKQLIEQYDNFLEQEEVTVIEILAIIATCSDTHLFDFLQQQGLKSQDINHGDGEYYWNELYNDNKNYFIEDVTNRAEDGEIRVTGMYSEANAPDTETLGEDSKSIHETPVGLARRRRANSLEGNQEDLDAARKASQGQTRSFIRTWVQVVKDPENE